MNKAQQTIQRRKEVLAILGEGWKASKGIEGARDMYKRGSVVVMPQRTIDGNFYVGSKRGFDYAKTIEEAAVMAKKFETAAA